MSDKLEGLFESCKDRIDEIETEFAVNLLLIKVEHQLAVERLEDRIKILL